MSDRPSTNLGRSLGLRVKDLADTTSPMGSWTGLDPLLGAPLSGALWGSGVGALYHLLGDKLMGTIKGEPVDPRKNLKKRLLQGASIGAGAGLASGVMQKLSYTQDVGRLVLSIMNDGSLTEFQKQELLRRISNADQATIRRILLSAGGGALTGAMIAAMLGGSSIAPFGAMGGAILGSMLSGNYFSR